MVVVRVAIAVFGLILTTSVDRCRTAANVVSSSVYVDVPTVGRVVGVRSALTEGALVDSFLGIPYAKPPVGSLRFKPPVDLDPLPKGSQKIINATRLPSSCFQVVDRAFDGKYVDVWNPNTNLSEDCLYLNVWRPANATTSDKPKAVLVWIYGGGFTSGTSTLELYDGKFLSLRGDVIVVSMQYRVGPLGFLALGGYYEWGVAGNAGLLDQQWALRWVHEHIAAFGGDSERVTLFGESAGGASVSYQLLSPGSEALFRSAIMESSTVVADWNYIDRDLAETKARELAKLVGCGGIASDKDILACLRQASAQDLTTQQFSVSTIGAAINSAFHPTLDNRFITRPPAELLRTGQFQKKDILVGANSNEGSYFLIYMLPDLFGPPKWSANITSSQYSDAVRSLSVVNTSKAFVLKALEFEYSKPCGASYWSSDYEASLDLLLGDAIFTCTVVNFARTFATDAERPGQNHSVYVYLFNHRTSGNPWPTWTGVAHGYEIDHVFGVPLQAGHEADYTDDERTLSSYFITYWTNFAKTGNPNRGDDGQTTTPKPPEWPKYNISQRNVQVLDVGSGMRVQRGLRERECDYWLSIVPQLEGAAAAASVSGYRLQAAGLPWAVLLSMLAVFSRH